MYKVTKFADFRRCALYQCTLQSWNFCTCACWLSCSIVYSDLSIRSLSLPLRESTAPSTLVVTPNLLNVHLFHKSTSVKKSLYVAFCAKHTAISTEKAYVKVISSYFPNWRMQEITHKRFHNLRTFFVSHNKILNLSILIIQQGNLLILLFFRIKMF